MLTLEYLKNQYKGVSVNDAIKDIEHRIFMNEMQNRMDFNFDRMLNALLKELKTMQQ